MPASSAAASGSWSANENATGCDSAVKENGCENNVKSMEFAFLILHIFFAMPIVVYF